MAPKAGAKPKEGGDKAPLPLRVGEAEKMRKPTARMGKDVPDSARESSRGGKKSGQVSNRGGKSAAAKAGTDAKAAASSPKKDEKKVAKIDEKGATATASAKPAAAEASTASMPKVVSSQDKVGQQKKKIDFLTEELMGRKPLDEKSREALAKKCGPPKQEVHHERNEGHRPIGRLDELAPSRHERVPPSCIVLMLNCFESSFDLVAGDISTLPESETSDLRSLTSGKVLGRVKITPEKGAHRAPRDTAHRPPPQAAARARAPP